MDCTYSFHNIILWEVKILPFTESAEELDENNACLLYTSDAADDWLVV